MVGSFNRVTLIGNVVRDPELRYVGSGAAVAKFTLALNRRSKDQTETTYVDIVAWDKLAEICNTHLKKGAPAFIEGRLSIRSYETKEGEKRKATEIVCSTVRVLDRAAREDAAPSNGNGRQESSDEEFEDEPLDSEIPF